MRSFVHEGVCRSVATFVIAILSEDNEWTSRRDHGECDFGHWLIGRGCLGGDRLGLIKSH